MPSQTFTIVLAVLAIGFGTLAGVHLAQHDLSSIFGALPRRHGEDLYKFDLDNVHTVRIRNNIGEEAVFRKRGNAWVMLEPLVDRADYRDLQRIVYFSRHLRVEDVVRRRDISLEESGMRQSGMHRGRFLVMIEDRDGREVAAYRLGRRTAWHHLDEETGEVAQTFFVRPNERAQKDYIYICSAPTNVKPSVRQILDRGFERLRDHRPFLFDPAHLAEVTIRHRGGEVVLTRAAKDSPWRMTKPLESRTRPETMAGLLAGLYELQAVKVHEAGAVTIPPRSPAEFYLEIELRRFGADGNRQERAVTLTVEPPSGPHADTVYATMGTSRPAVVFELPFKPAKDRFALQQLPIEVDQLRNRTLASLDISALRSVTIHSLGQSEPVELALGRTVPSASAPPRWMVRQRGALAPANEVAIAELLQAVTRHEVVSYASDAARDLSAYGLAPPRKRLLLEGGQDETIDLLFGRGADGNFYAMRRGSSTVAEITPITYTAIASHPIGWRDTLLMHFSAVSLAAMKIERPIRPPRLDSSAMFNYSYLDESWSARQYGEDATARLNTQRANSFLRMMEELRIDKWVGEAVPAAEEALRNPTFRFTALFREFDDQGDRTGLREASFELAPAGRLIYGRLGGDPSYFVIGLETYRLLTAPLLDQE